MSVFTSLAFFKLSVREKTLLSWAGLRGAVPIVLATFPFLFHLPNAELYFNIVFFTVLTSSLIQGSFLEKVAKSLRMLAQDKNA
jgi:cell volume regulation protein A